MESEFYAGVPGHMRSGCDTYAHYSHKCDSGMFGAHMGTCTFYFQKWF